MKQTQLAGWILGDLDPLFEFEWEGGGLAVALIKLSFAFRMGACSRFGAYSNKY